MVDDPKNNDVFAGAADLDAWFANTPSKGDLKPTAQELAAMKPPEPPKSILPKVVISEPPFMAELRAKGYAPPIEMPEQVAPTSDKNVPTKLPASETTTNIESDTDPEIPVAKIAQEKTAAKPDWQQRAKKPQDVILWIIPKNDEIANRMASEMGTRKSLDVQVRHITDLNDLDTIDADLKVYKDTGDARNPKGVIMAGLGRLVETGTYVEDESMLANQQSRLNYLTTSIEGIAKGRATVIHAPDLNDAINGVYKDQARVLEAKGKLQEHATLVQGTREEAALRQISKIVLDRVDKNATPTR